MNTQVQQPAAAAAALATNVAAIGVKPDSYITEERIMPLTTSLGFRLGGSGVVHELKPGVTPPKLPDVGFLTKYWRPVRETLYDVVVEAGIGGTINGVVTAGEWVDEKVVTPVARAVEPVATSVTQAVGGLFSKATTKAIDAVDDRTVHKLPAVAVLSEDEQKKRAEEKAKEDGAPVAKVELTVVASAPAAAPAEPAAAAAQPAVSDQTKEAAVQAAITKHLDALHAQNPELAALVAQGIGAVMNAAQEAEQAAEDSVNVKAAVDIMASVDQVAPMAEAPSVAMATASLPSPEVTISAAPVPEPVAKVLEVVEMTVQSSEAAADTTTVKVAIVDSTAEAAPVGETIAAAALATAPQADSQPSAATMAEELKAKQYGLFDTRFKSIRQTVPFKPGWITDAGSLEPMLDDDTLKSYVGVGKHGRTLDTQGRKVIITGTPTGPVVVYQAEPEGRALHFVAPPAVRMCGLIRSKGPELDPQEIELVLGSGDGKQRNIGKSLAALMGAAAKSEV